MFALFTAWYTLCRKDWTLMTNQAAAAGFASEESRASRVRQQDRLRPERTADVPTQYTIAIVVAAIISGLGVLYVFQTKAAFRNRLRSDLHQMKADGTLPPELENLEIETADFDGLDVEITAAMLWRLEIANILRGLWFVWILLVLSACLAVAYLAGM